MTCDILANGLAGSETEIVEGQQMGSLDMSVMCGVLQNFDSALMFLEWDFLFVNQEHLEEILYGEVGDRIEQRILDTTGIRVLDVFKDPCSGDGGAYGFVDRTGSKSDTHGI